MSVSLFVSWLTAQAEPAVGGGVISGGWNFIWAAWIVTWAALAGYGISLIARAPAPATAASRSRKP